MIATGEKPVVTIPNDLIKKSNHTGTKWNQITYTYTRTSTHTHTHIHRYMDKKQGKVDQQNRKDNKIIKVLSMKYYFKCK